MKPITIPSRIPIFRHYLLWLRWQLLTMYNHDIAIRHELRSISKKEVT